MSILCDAFSLLMRQPRDVSTAMARETAKPHRLIRVNSKVAAPDQLIEALDWRA